MGGSGGTTLSTPAAGALNERALQPDLLAGALEIRLFRTEPRPYSRCMLLIVGSIRIPPETVAEARAAARRMIEATRAEEGCVHYAFAEDVLDPGLIHIHELWRDQAALDAHFASAHMAAWRAALRAIGPLDRNLRIHEVGEGRPL